jgi:replicative DNA helicase
MLAVGPDRANDTTIVSQEIRERGLNIDHFFLSGLIELRPPERADDYVRIIIDAWARSELLRAIQRAFVVLESGGGLDFAVAELSAAIGEAASAKVAESTFTPGPLVDRILDEADSAATRPTGPGKGIVTGFHDLDRALVRIMPEQLMIVGGRPGMGKTIFAQNVSEHLALSGGRVLFFSLEMRPEELAERFVASRALVNYGDVRSRTFGPDEFAACARANEALHTKGIIWHKGSRKMTVADVVAHTRSVTRMYGDLDLVVVDYLGKLRPSGNNFENRAQQVGEIAFELKDAARELGLPFLVVQQLNRAVESREKKIPTLADLRDSGVIEQEADIVVLLGDPEGEKKAINAYIAKNRNGRIGAVGLVPRFRYQRFFDRELE